MSAADASDAWLLMIGFANSFKKFDSVPRKFGIRKSNVAQISLTLFWIGVPGWMKVRE